MGPSARSSDLDRFVAPPSECPLPKRGRQNSVVRSEDAGGAGAWTAEVMASLPRTGFRIPRPRPGSTGRVGSRRVDGVGTRSWRAPNLGRAMAQRMIRRDPLS